MHEGKLDCFGEVAMQTYTKNLLALVCIQDT